MRPNVKDRDRVRPGIDRKEKPPVAIDDDILVAVERTELERGIDHAFAASRERTPAYGCKISVIIAAKGQDRVAVVVGLGVNDMLRRCEEVIGIRIPVRRSCRSNRYEKSDAKSSGQRRCSPMVARRMFHKQIPLAVTAYSRGLQERVRRDDAIGYMRADQVAITTARAGLRGPDEVELRPQQQLAHHLAAFEQLMRASRLGERQALIDAWLDLAARQALEEPAHAGLLRLAPMVIDMHREDAERQILRRLGA